MNNITKHTLIALILTILMYPVSPFIGAWTAIVFYYSRELNQFQSKFARDRGLNRSQVWYKGLLTQNWDSRSRLQFIIPAFSSIVLAVIMTEIL